MTTIVLGVDGTGPLSTTAYSRSMHNSFVNYIVRNSSSAAKRYLRGKGYQFVHLHKVATPGAKVLLTGYSRGGSAVIDVAGRLRRDGVEVNGMVLFDPVDRSPTSSGEVIPRNVLRVW